MSKIGGKMEKAKIIKVIKTENVIGNGEKQNPIRKIIQYWELNGKLIATFDSYLESTKSDASSEVNS